MNAKDIALMKKLGGGGGGLPSGGTPYQQLVTDGNGNTVWEYRLAYADSKLVGYDEQGRKIVKVSDEVPSWATVDAPMKVWISNGADFTAIPEEHVNLGSGSFQAGDAVIIIATDNIEWDGLVFPEKGVYFFADPNGMYVTGIASADSDTPEITWGGDVEEIKKLDEKFLPEPLILYTH